MRYINSNLTSHTSSITKSINTLLTDEKESCVVIFELIFCTLITLLVGLQHKSHKYKTSAFTMTLISNMYISYRSNWYFSLTILVVYANIVQLHLQVVILGPATKKQMSLCFCVILKYIWRKYENVFDSNLHIKRCCHTDHCQ